MQDDSIEAFTDGFGKAQNGGAFFLWGSGESRIHAAVNSSRPWRTFLC